MTHARIFHATPAGRSRHGAFITSAMALAALALPLAGCASTGNAAPADANSVTIVVHETFPSEEFAVAASEATGLDVKVVTGGDGGELTNKLVLTRGAPIADAFFGVDTMFGSRLVSHDVVAPYVPADLPESALDFALEVAEDNAEASAEDRRALIESTGMVPVDHGSTCVNIDTGWFTERSLEAPASYEDLADPAYKDLTLLLDPTASSTGASFLVGTIAAFGEDGFADYWQQLIDNGARVEQGWSEAYYGQFTQGGEDGTRPIVVSYASSPAFTVDEAGTASSTAALLDTCTRQVEYAGVLAGAENEAGAKAVIDYLVSGEFQATIPDSMYMTPVDDEAPVPAEWSTFAPEPAIGQTHDLPAAQIEAERESWLATLSEQIGL